MVVQDVFDTQYVMLIISTVYLNALGCPVALSMTFFLTNLN